MSEQRGGCHCGKVRFRVRAKLEGLTECNCSMCSKKGIVHLIVPRDAFSLDSDWNELTYTFNTGVAQHYFCKTCGIHAFYVPRSDPDKIDVNVRWLDGVDVKALEIAPFNGRNWEESMTRDVPGADAGSGRPLRAGLVKARE